MLIFLCYLLLISAQLGFRNYFERVCLSSCGDLQDIHYPLRLRGDPPQCGMKSHELSCEGNRTVFSRSNATFYVTNISYVVGSFVSLTLVDVGVAHNNCSLPGTSVSSDFFNRYKIDVVSSYSTFLNCSRKISNERYRFVPCLSTNSSFTYVIDDYDANTVGILAPYCHVVLTTMVSDSTDSHQDIFQLLREGFQILLWTYPTEFSVNHVLSCAAYDPHDLYLLYEKSPYAFLISIMLYPFRFEKDLHICLGQLFYSRRRDYLIMGVLMVLVDAPMLVVAILLLGRFVLAPLCLMVFLFYNISMHLIPIDIIESFLQRQIALSPTRYSYNEILSITNNFKEKLGQGGFGSVFKGRLPGGYLVAVKMLGNSMGNGEDFINEVSTIGMIHHVNIVQLVGFCAEGTNRALIYEFMSNGSLDKYIFASREKNQYFNDVKINEIALSVAKALRYLHQGCEMQILHFDIKPHNVLLDQHFTPKLSDFGLAKLQPKNKSLVSMSVARGTIGYIAPELVSRSFGNVSHKSDVYSFGMLLMDMAGGRRHADMKAEKSSQLYYPSWIYDQLQQTEALESHGILEIDDMERKLCKVGLWCIQTRPIDRPSMTRVVEMLEADVDSIQIPPKPFFSVSEPLLVPSSSLSEISVISEY